MLCSGRLESGAGRAGKLGSSRNAIWCGLLVAVVGDVGEEGSEELADVLWVGRGGSADVCALGGGGFRHVRALGVCRHPERGIAVGVFTFLVLFSWASDAESELFFW